MGLDMYLYRATKKNIENLNHLEEVKDDLDKMWAPIIANELPKNWDKSKMTEQQRKLVDERNYELDIIDQKRLAIRDEVGGYIEYWRNFNTLHKYIVDNFADGVDNRHEIPLTKDNVVQIMNYLNHIVDVLTTSKNWNIPTDDSYSDNIIRAIDIFSMFAKEWDDDYVVLYLAF